ncbi:uncharacterized protein LOC134802364 isoform X3 [Cydia splendana]|uniref:uncharacterized protein LOC134802364 isoform X3 n=1 Tax=Cydia splendana TaxID=1100963 RepID=UPI00300D77DC
MDKDISSVGTQYIICECGDNFPNEKFLNIHLANNHGEVESFLCDECPEAFTSNNSLSYHKRSHEKTKQAPGRPETIKTYTRKTPQKKEPVVKKPPVLKLKNLKRIDSISLIENLKSLGGIIKIEHTPSAPDPVPEPEPDPEPEVPVLEETDEGQVVVKNEAMEEAEEIYYQCDVVRSLWHLIFGPGPEPETPVLEETDEGQVVVKNEAMEEAEEIYYQCDVCNSIFYTEWEFNIHYQSKHALKLEPSSSAELILEQHLVSDHGVEGIKTEADTEDTAYYYECELGKEEIHKPALQSVNTGGKSTDAVQMTDSVKPDDVERSNKTEMTGQVQEHSENDIDKELAQNSEPSQTVQMTDNIKDVNINKHVKLEVTVNDQENDLLKVVGEMEIEKRGRPKKKKPGRPLTYDVYADMPPGSSRYQIEKLAKERKIEKRKEQLREATRTYNKKIGVEGRREVTAKYKMNNPEKVAEINRKSSTKYKMNNPEKVAEINRKSSAKYRKNNPERATEINRRASAKYKINNPEKFAETNRKSSTKYARRHPEVGRRASKKYYEKKKLEKLGIKVEVSEVEPECESILGF